VLRSLTRGLVAGMRVCKWTACAHGHVWGDDWKRGRVKEMREIRRVASVTSVQSLILDGHEIQSRADRVCGHIAQIMPSICVSMILEGLKGNRNASV
jgi:hypothetical protein